MRVPQNDRLSEPERRCILTGDHARREMLVRLACGPEGQIAPDVRARAPGRGAWIGVTKAELETALTKGKLKGALNRAFKTTALTIPDDLADRVESELTHATLNRLGLEARASTIATGSDRIGEAARRGNVHMLLHASDAGDDGCRKLAQAWRVGREAEGSGLSGIMLSIDRERLSAALGRENTVHLAVTDKGAAKRIAADLYRWHHFIGRQTPEDLAESPPKVHGASLNEDDAHDTDPATLGSETLEQEARLNT
jgi:uncharacterized protein